MYKLTQSGNSIIRKSDTSFIPISEANLDYVEYLDWLAKGNTPEPADIPVPSAVAPLQARIALLKAGKLAQVEAAVAAGDEETKLAWEYATEFTRQSPIVLGLGAAIGLTDKDLDQLFIVAATILL